MLNQTVQTWKMFTIIVTDFLFYWQYTKRLVLQRYELRARFKVKYLTNFVVICPRTTAHGCLHHYQVPMVVVYYMIMVDKATNSSLTNNKRIGNTRLTLQKIYLSALLKKDIQLIYSGHGSYYTNYKSHINNIESKTK